MHIDKLFISLVPLHSYEGTLMFKTMLLWHYSFYIILFAFAFLSFPGLIHEPLEPFPMAKTDEPQAAEIVAIHVCLIHEPLKHFPAKWHAEVGSDNHCHYHCPQTIEAAHAKIISVSRVGFVHGPWKFNNRQMTCIMLPHSCVYIISLCIYFTCR